MAAKESGEETVNQLTLLVVCESIRIAVTEGREAAHRFFERIANDGLWCMSRPRGMDQEEYQRFVYDHIDRALEEKENSED